MEKRERGKKAQMYIIAALIIIFIIVGFAGISNYVTVKKEPQKFYNIGDVLKLEGIHVVENLNYNKVSDLNTNVNTFLDLFANYTKENINEDFSFVILYGDAASGNVSATIYSRASAGGVSIYLGSGAPFTLAGSGQVKREQASVKVNQDKQTVDVVLSSGEGLNITQTLPILKDNNFVFVMTTSSGFNQYIQSK